MIKAQFKSTQPISVSALVLAAGLCCFLSVGSSFAQAVPEQHRYGGSITEIPLPAVAPYWVTATRQSSGAIVFDGFAPDEKTRSKFAADRNASVQWLRLGGGAPERYGEALDFGLSVLDQLTEGRVALRDNVITVSGTAETQQAFIEITSNIAERTPAGLVLARAEILAPMAEAYQWQMSKSINGAFSMSGMVPDRIAEKVLLASAGQATQSDVSYASGHPNNFARSARSGVDLLQKLIEGRVSFDGSGWLLTGTAKTQADKTALESEFERQQLAAAGWSMAVTTAAPSATDAASTIDPDYSFAAVKSANDLIIFSGQLPAEPALRFFGAITGGNIDAVSISSGAPPEFIGHAEVGVRALMLLREGALSFSDGTWSISGSAEDAPARDAATALLSSSPQYSWKTDINLVAEASPVAIQPEAVANVAPAERDGMESVDCEAPLAEFSARNAIVFRSGAALITPESAPALAELAIDLAACPNVPIHVEGHTDADGTEQLNLALSVARAEAVVNALIERGINPARLYAVGYGESTPIADNTTPEGKSQNRRIVVKLAPAAD